MERPFTVFVAGVLLYTGIAACSPVREPIPGPEVKIADVDPKPRITPEEIVQACNAIKMEAFLYSGIEAGEAVARIESGPYFRDTNYNVAIHTREQGSYYLNFNPNYNEFEPDISPDKKKVVFQRVGPSRTILGDKEFLQVYDFIGNEGLYTTNIDGSDEFRLTENPEGITDSMPSWSPDGSKITFARRDSNDPEKNNELFSINSDGTELTKLATGFRHIVYPRYSPDGTRIAFRADSTPYIIDTDGSNLRQVIDKGAVDGPTGMTDLLFWSLDSKHLVIGREKRLPDSEWIHSTFLVDINDSAIFDITAVCPIGSTS